MNKRAFLAMSLPYDLKVAEFNDEGKIQRAYTLCGGNYNSFSKFNYYKPILRPLSDLTKPIEHKGERFVPITEIQKRNDFIHILNGSFVIGAQSVYELDELPTWVTQLLIKWHFDLGGFIPREEAVDVNTLTKDNPYK